MPHPSTLHPPPPPTRSSPPTPAFPRSVQSDVIKRNTGLRNLQGNVFVFRTPVVQVSVYHDLSRDGQRQSGEPLVAGATVTITDPSGAVVGTTSTNSNGLVRTRVLWFA